MESRITILGKGVIISAEKIKSDGNVTFNRFGEEEVVTLDMYIDYLKEISMLGYGDKQIGDEETNDNPYAYYDSSQDKLYI